MIVNKKVGKEFLVRFPGKNFLFSWPQGIQNSCCKQV